MDEPLALMCQSSECARIGSCSWVHLETFLYTFYKMWEEHQKRHYRAKFEEDVRAFFQSHGYECEKITQPTEVNGAIPPSNPQVVMQIRTGV